MEKRRFSRIIYKNKAIINNQQNEVEGIIKDLSLKSIFIQSDLTFNVNDILNISIPLTDEITINATGHILRIENNGFVLIIDEIDIDSFMFLKNLIAYNIGDSESINKEFLESISK